MEGGRTGSLKSGVRAVTLKEASYCATPHYALSADAQSISAKGTPQAVANAGKKETGTRRANRAHRINWCSRHREKKGREREALLGKAGKGITCAEVRSDNAFRPPMLPAPEPQPMGQRSMQGGGCGDR